MQPPHVKIVPQNHKSYKGTKTSKPYENPSNSTFFFLLIQIKQIYITYQIKNYRSLRWKSKIVPDGGLERERERERRMLPYQVMFRDFQKIFKYTILKIIMIPSWIKLEPINSKFLIKNQNKKIPNKPKNQVYKRSHMNPNKSPQN